MHFAQHILRQGALALSAALALSCSGNRDAATLFEQYTQEYAQTHSFTTHHIPRDGGMIRARQFGTAFVPGDPVIVMMHGYPDSQHLYDRIAPELAKERSVITFDFLGWGASDKPEGIIYDFDGLRQDLDTVVEYFALEHVVPVAHASSGPPAIDWALDNPAHTTALVLLNAFYHDMESLKLPEAIVTFSTPGPRRSFLMFGAKRNDWIWQRSFRRQVSKFFPDDGELRSTYTAVFTHQALEIRPAFFALNGDTWNAIGKRNANVELMQAFPKPVGVFFGIPDQYLNESMAKEFDALFPHSTLTLMEGGGHYPQLEKPKETAREILSIIAESDGALHDRHAY